MTTGLQLDRWISLSVSFSLSGSRSQAVCLCLTFFLPALPPCLRRASPTGRWPRGRKRIPISVPLSRSDRPREPFCPCLRGPSFWRVSSPRSCPETDRVLTLESKCSGCCEREPDRRGEAGPGARPGRWARGNDQDPPRQDPELRMRRPWGAVGEPRSTGWGGEWAAAQQETLGARPAGQEAPWRGGSGRRPVGLPGPLTSPWQRAPPAVREGGSRAGRPVDSGTAPSCTQASCDRLRRPEPPQQHENRCGPSPPADARRAAAAAVPMRSMEAQWRLVAGGRRRGRGLPRNASTLAAAGLMCTALAAYACWGQLPSLPWSSPTPAGRSVGVLLWWEPFGGRGRASRPPPDCWLRFNISGCRLLTDRTAYGEAQAVLFHHRDLVWGPPDWPPPWGAQVSSAEDLQLRMLDDPEEAAISGPRPPGQRWVWMNFESPTHSPGLRALAGNLFNWTLSYRADSDIFVPYGYLYPRRHPGDQPRGLVPPLARKRGLVAWVVSHWDERQARVHYYHQLSQHLPVDVFGRSGPGRPVPNSGLLHTVARYKFYLAFENSQHLDYITEKLWRNALLAGAVPVVLGPDRANYERFVPRNSFIHVDDFPSASSLAAYLLFLDRNPAVYRRYFHWRRRYAVHITSFWDEPWCRACQAVQTAGDQPKSIRNLANWFER
ncbi:alpha-(1,3)-fucosyltransferase 4 [Cavia porcellus]|uniref:alpha-(1,3)-fucosyltransferase 4 n=1 Tax=Cavia porcellus TaxID=10141 RepID=UPI002FE0E15F